MPTDERIARIKQVLSCRQPDLRVVLEEVTNVHNASAVLRTCDAAGVLNVDIIGAKDDLLPLNSAITTRADKWLSYHYYRSTADCLRSLKLKGFTIAATHLGQGALEYTDMDYARPIAVVFGSESEGISPEALCLADHKIRIPMLGMVQSLNLSVSVGIVLYEALRQRLGKGYFKEARLSPEEFEDYFRKWLDL